MRWGGREQRRAERVPATALGARVRRPAHQAFAYGQVRDVSELGIALVLPADAAGVLDFAVRVELTLELPGGRAVIDGTIRRRSPRADGTLYGIELEPETSSADALACLRAWLAEMPVAA